LGEAPRGGGFFVGSTFGEGVTVTKYPDLGGGNRKKLVPPENVEEAHWRWCGGEGFHLKSSKGGASE